jgi:hypothetical protein
MTPAQQKTSDGRKNSLVRFLAGLGVGLAAGWSAWLFRRRSHSRPNTAIAGEPTAASHEAAIAKSDVLEEATAQGSGRIDDPEQITNSPVAPTPDNASTSQSAATLDEASFDNVEDSEPQPHPAGNEVFDPPSDSHQIDDVPKAAIEDSSGAGPEASVELPGIEAPQSAPAFEEDEHPNTQPISLSDASEADGVSPPPSNVNAAHEPTIRRPRAAESTTEYGTSIGHLLPVEYLRWNRWLIEHAIATSQANEEIYLSITPTILAGVAADQGGALASPEDAEAQFVAALRNAYATIIAHNGRLQAAEDF